MKRIPFGLIVIILVALWLVLQPIISLYPDLLWFDNLGFASVFWTNLKAKLLTAFAFGLLFFVIATVNVFLSRRLTRDNRRVRQDAESPERIKQMIAELFGERAGEGPGLMNVTPDPAVERRGYLLWGLGILVVSIFFGLSAITQWEVVLKYLNSTSFGLTDPIFKRDIGFYVFQLPLQQFLQGFVFTALIMSFFASLWNYLLNGAVFFSQLRLSFGRGVKVHLAVLLALITLVFAWGLWLGELEILYSARGVVYGAGYTDVTAQLLGYNLQIFVLAITAVLFLAMVFTSNYRLPLAGLAAYLVVALFMGGIYPAIVQNFQVKPNEISMEEPYIAHAIRFTRQAYGLDKIEAKEFAADQSLSLRDVRRNNQTIGNIRLWDPRPLIKTYRQLQGIRLYYDFDDVDVDRYTIGRDYRQVMLSARELKVDKLPAKAQTWVNQHLKFTHGYGLCLSPVNEQTPEGLPNLIVKDIPPVSTRDLKIERPEIYYGEETGQYVIVNTDEQEFDYPKGDKNIYSDYKGRGGVLIDTALKRLAFTIKFADLKILLTDYINNDSRVMFDRNIHRRVRKVVPFLSYDRDPYMVIASGRLFWIQDAYTTTDMYPYSDPTGGSFSSFNYIRNAVKVVIDAYNGDMTYYLVDGADPIALTYQKIYPALFRPFAQMPQELRAHLRYPEDLFLVQSRKYAAFHMDDPQVFYNQEDLWNLPKEIYADSEVAMVPYYTIMRLPGEKEEEFLLMLPYTPNNKDNMIAWLAGRSDGAEYGKLIVYKFPKDKLIYGPMQIEARIDQQTEISQQFTLWGQAGSRVIRGNLLAIPIEQSIVYIEPIYLEATSGSLPEFKRVIAVYGKNVAMETTLDGALSAVFSGRVSSARTRQYETETALSPKALAKQALQIYNNMQGSLKQGNFAAFGQRLQELGGILRNMAK
ncbi:MAG: UPF0182 family protein [Candidatus Saganbacteria bacterium]|nr:UPF0182 family protein [Candidatus Saganbacteria bacterium]